MTHEFEQYFSPPGSSWAGRTGKTMPPIGSVEEDAHDGRYRAFGVIPTDDLDACSVSWWLTAEVAQGQDFQYRYLLRVGYIGDTTLHLFLTDCVIHIEGRNLTELRKKLSRQKVSFIQAFNPGIWAKPECSEPYIDTIAILQARHGDKQ